MVAELLLLTILGLFGPGDVGTTAFPLLKVPVGPRACAMGETFTGLADDVNSLFWNPAGMAQLHRTQVALSHHEWFAATRDENLASAFPVGPGFLGIGAVHSMTGGIEVWDPENNRKESVTAHSGYLAIGYAIRPVENLYCGLSIKGLYDRLIDQTGIGGCADVGLVYRPTNWLSVGLAGKNLGPGIWYGSEDYPLPMAARVGLCYNHSRFRVLFDANAPVDNSPDFHLGGEYAAHEFITVRGGLRLGPQDWRTLGLLSVLTGGLGIHYDRYVLDYSIVPYGPLGLTHQLALRMSFKAGLHGRVAIQVLEFGTNEPVEASLKPEWIHQGLSRTDKAGSFVLEGIEPGWLKVTATADGYYPAAESVLVEVKTTRRIKLVMRKSGFGSLWGAIYDAATHRTLPARVEYSGPVNDSIETDPLEGSFILRKLPAGDYNLRISAIDSGYAELTETVTIEPGKLASRTFLLAAPTEEVTSDSEQTIVPEPEKDDQTGEPPDETPATPLEEEPAPAGDRTRLPIEEEPVISEQEG